MSALATFERFLLDTGKIKEAFFKEAVPYDARQVPHLFTAKRLMKFVNMDSIYFQFAEMVRTNSSHYFKEDLSNYSDFRRDEVHYHPILDPKDHPLDYFRSPEEPYLEWEEAYDNKTIEKDRVVRRSYLTRDSGTGDQRLKYQYEVQNMNNSYIMRGIHVTVRDYEGNIINSEYGPAGPFADSPEKSGKVLWYRPHDTLHPDYVLGEEELSTFVFPRPPLFRIEEFIDRKGVYFQRFKRSIFLPKCIREKVAHREFLTHFMVRCPAGVQEPVADDFYEALGIEKGKDYFFEYMNVW